ncbi:hypothetical protein IR009_15850 [Pseudomonas putida]|uniref:hypothetical protein n=1 Tax=Pseudomonas putida group TaxID=136845 RepID=UPI0018AA56B0|nr:MULTISPECIES: hypothetical protein [Pseudomonas putida group]MBF8766694.1 hypothetical protein [Pseudomonas putida]MEC4022550.1 hypothetical protein [Pseudomonas fulva]
MLDMAQTGRESFEAVGQVRLTVSETESQLIQRYRQMPEQERGQVERLIALLARNPESLEI